MKIILNKSHLGLFLNAVTLKKLAMENGHGVRAMTIKQFHFTDEHVLHAIGDGFMTNEIESYVKKGDIIYFPEYGNELRTSPELIKMVENDEQIGSPETVYKVVEIPDDVDWYIDDRNGQEFVAEKHRTWE